MCTSGKCAGWCPSHYMCYTTQLTQTQLFVLKSIAVKFKTLICIGNALQCSKYGACSLKSKRYTEWRTGPRFRHQTASMGSYETAAILLSDIESNWKLLLLLGIPNAISMQNFSLISRKLSVFSCIFVQHRAQVRAPVCTPGKCADWCPSHYMLYYATEPDTTFFSIKAFAVKFKTLINIGNVCKSSKYGVCSLK